MLQPSCQDCTAVLLGRKVMKLVCRPLPNFPRCRNAGKMRRSLPSGLGCSVRVSCLRSPLQRHISNTTRKFANGARRLAAWQRRLSTLSQSRFHSYLSSDAMYLLTLLSRQCISRRTGQRSTKAAVSSSFGLFAAAVSRQASQGRRSSICETIFSATSAESRYPP